MNLNEINENVSHKTGLSKKDVASVTGAIIAAIADALVAHEEVRISGLGTFTAKSVAEKKGRNPQTGEALTIPASVKAAFKAAKPLSDALNA